MDDGPRRTGIGFFPEAVVIRAGPSRPQPAPYDADDGEYPTPYSVNTNASAGPSRPPPPRLTQGRDSWSLWKDWHTNPSGHGGRRGPPVFVPATQTYDELGRSVLDGFGVDVDAGEVEKKDEGERQEAGGVADWYRSLSAGKSKTEVKPITAPTVPSPPQPTASTIVTTTSSTTQTPAPLRVPRSEWFIRRALANSASASSSTPTSRPSTPSSIGSMLGNIDTANPKVAPAPRVRYALGPDNVGYTRLEALGWGGGGLGRPEGWEEREAEVKRERDETPTRPRPRSPPNSSGSGSATPIDLTGDTDSDSDSPSGAISIPVSDDDDDDDNAPRGPGRTAPIATALKLDRLGLGRSRAEKKVTHTAAEIASAQRRARGVKPNKPGEAVGKKPKVKWAEKERREREERKRIAATLNAW
ncbi:uncharacterized protein EHS24_002658 [Apiotrichum porosum]|uniref:G-patch domain-containing protein n=1 Tax=Apiotrichum porosum TaxID=105984 RepID=A0A427XHG2_9TREE|nr:uncharacterized protein EHS24_002658 [Apiotrichum porosum]RSH78197.1 hypothetical protein EHS24_002658 [Apiotrichum porosum]